MYGDSTSGWSSMVCIMFFVGGVQLLYLGSMGQYLSKTYLEVKRRSLYIVEETEKSQKQFICYRYFKIVFRYSILIYVFRNL